MKDSVCICDEADRRAYTAWTRSLGSWSATPGSLQQPGQRERPLHSTHTEEPVCCGCQGQCKSLCQYDFLDLGEVEEEEYARSWGVDKDTTKCWSSEVVALERTDLSYPRTTALTAQTRNSKDKRTHTGVRRETQAHPKSSFNNNGKDEEEEQGKEGYTGRDREEDEEEDIDEVMKEEEVEEESEESSGLIRCQSPDTPMTDSSYSETGSLLETPYPFSPETSPEPTSPVIPVISPETVYPISPVEFSQSDVSNTGSVAFTTGPIDSATLTVTSDTGPTIPAGPTCITEAADRIAKNTDGTTEHLTSFTEPVFSHGLATSYAGPNTSAAETLKVTACTTRLNTFVTSTPMSAATGTLASTAGPMTTGTESTSTTGPITSNWEHITSMPVPTCFSVSTCASGPIPNPALLESLEQLAQRGDDTHLPHYLHQIAEAFVLQEDYQRALWCIQLERLYHQRVLNNLNTLQEQWESQCKRTSSDLETQHLDALKHICQTHSRPRAGDAV
ncbi:consortin, partial [Lates japonicus]